LVKGARPLMEDEPREYAFLIKELQSNFNPLSKGDYYRRLC